MRSAVDPTPDWQDRLCEVLDPIKVVAPGPGVSKDTKREGTMSRSWGQLEIMKGARIPSLLVSADTHGPSVVSIPCMQNMSSWLWASWTRLHEKLLASLVCEVLYTPRCSGRQLSE